MSGRHSIIPPSSAGIWGKPGGCSGWVIMSQQTPVLNETTQSTLEGETSHEVGAALIKTMAHRGSSSINKDDYINKKSSNGIIIDDAMFSGALMYADDVNEIMRKTGVFGGEYLGVEKRLTMPAIHDLSFGTIDSCIFDQRNGELYLWDYKFGFVMVEAFENWQLLNYLAGLIDLYNISGHADQHITVHFRIAQPRAYHYQGSIREWSANLAELRGYFNILKANAEKSLSNDSELNTGSHCKFCDCRYNCPAASKAGFNLFEVTEKPVPQQLSIEQLSVQLALVKRALEQLSSLEIGYEEQITHMIKNGTLVPGWLLENGKGRETWRGSTNEVIILGDLLGHDLRKPDNVITPNQARKLGIDPAIIKEYSHIPNTGLKLIRDNGNRARQYFKPI